MSKVLPFANIIAQMVNRTYHPRGTLVEGVPPQRHPLYFTWANMLSRCYNPANPSYSNYGGRGIGVDPRWHHFAQFVEDMGAKPNPKLTIERVDNMAGYGPGNCVWATPSDQAVNRRVFRNNTSGSTGVVPIRNGWEARFDYEKTRYRLGRFNSAAEAASVRDAFVGLFFRDRGAALAMIPEETLWRTSSTGVRGVTKHPDGGYIARATVDGARKYLGYFKSLKEAAAAVAPYRKKKD